MTNRKRHYLELVCIVGLIMGGRYLYKGHVQTVEWAELEYSTLPDKWKTVYEKANLVSDKLSTFKYMSREGMPGLTSEQAKALAYKLGSWCGCDGGYGDFMNHLVYYVYKVK